MKLTPREKDKLMVSMAAIVARKRLERGIKLNYPEAIALITDLFQMELNWLQYINRYANETWRNNNNK